MGVELVRWPIPLVLRGDVVRMTGYAERLDAPVSYAWSFGTYVPGSEE